MKHYEIGSITIPLSSLEKNESLRFGLKFVSMDQRLENLRVKRRISFLLCVSVIAILNYHNWMGFIQTYQKP
jgi:hypothetical protein